MVRHDSRVNWKYTWLSINYFIENLASPISANPQSQKFPVCFHNSPWKAFTAKLGSNNFRDVGKSVSTKNLLWSVEIVNKTVKLVLPIYCACSLKLKFWLVFLVINYFRVCQFAIKANILQKKKYLFCLRQYYSPKFT